MQLAPLQMLAPVVAIGATSWCVGRALPRGRRRRRAPATAILAGCGVVGALCALVLAVGSSAERDAGATAFVAVATLSALGIFGLLLTAGRRRPPDPGERRRDDEGGGGGPRRPPPDPSPPPTPASGGPEVQWEQFDDLRSQWERVPAGTR